MATAQPHRKYHICETAAPANDRFAAPLSAGARVVRIPELLEQILLGLATEPQGLRTLLLSQRTSHAFRDTITGTPSLQRALCFENAPATGRTVLNPFFQASKTHPIRLPNRNKLEIALPQENRPDWMIEIEPLEKVIYLNRSMRRGKFKKKSRKANAYGSWRQMRVFQEVGDDEKLTRLECCWIGSGTVSRENSVDGEWKNPTLGEIFDLLYPEEYADHVERLAKKEKMIN